MLLTLLASLALHDPKIVAPGEGEPVAVPFHPVFQLIGKGETESNATFYEFRVPPKTAGAPPHTHTKEDEFFYVLSGGVSLMNGDEITVAGPGTLAALTRGHLHAFWNAGDEEVVMLMATVGGEFEEFFDAVAMRLREEKPASPEAAGALVGQIAASKGITIDMSKVPAEARQLYGME
ncbi:cupin domain-containing protein [Parvularcula sp. ZS-1/3]|uniref:Cupin domain-containing protein n=1 Tax=Parvularcula mediterranea TaxID=2732508 RepID=A0A7Y3RPR6_9PROT|nr:cupin domain-containing protein [Parvularcula mediterranea]NNU17471.1 cupin domain-containing protein [Parvularcula mediterranea]